jgi:deoxycytidylate deaminase
MTELRHAKVAEGELWDTIRGALRNSTCLKTQTAAAIVKEGKILSMGSNLCAPSGQEYGERISFCPRMATKTGTGYELCSPVHAEVMACLNIRPNRSPAELGRFAGHLRLKESEILSAFTEGELRLLNGSTLYLVGHYWACENCEYVVRTVGAKEIKLDTITGEETKKAYEIKNLT